MGPKVVRFSMAEFEMYVYQRELIVYAQQNNGKIEHRFFSRWNVHWPTLEVN
jgi:hypothetical protein